jgi:hypothetical protein
MRTQITFRTSDWRSSCDHSALKGGENGPRSMFGQRLIFCGQGVVATLLRWINSSCSFRASAGVFQPRVLRGRLLRAAATAARSLGLCLLRSVPLGKYWRSSPLVFSLVPRCQGLCGSPKVDRQAGLDPELGVLGQLGALVPGQGAAQLVGQRRDPWRRWHRGPPRRRGRPAPDRS